MEKCWLRRTSQYARFAFRRTRLKLGALCPQTPGRRLVRFIRVSPSKGRWVGAPCSAGYAFSLEGVGGLMNIPPVTKELIQYYRVHLREQGFRSRPGRPGEMLGPFIVRWYWWHPERIKEYEDRRRGPEKVQQLQPRRVSHK
jgi:hypothetical protein